jgi:hypothetical protein
LFWNLTTTTAVANGYTNFLLKSNTNPGTLDAFDMFDTCPEVSVLTRFVAEGLHPNSSDVQGIAIVYVL